MKILEKKFVNIVSYLMVNKMVTKEFMDNYICDIQYRVLHGTLPHEDMRIVERYKEYKQHHEFKKVDFKKLMNMLVG